MIPTTRTSPVLAFALFTVLAACSGTSAPPQSPPAASADSTGDAEYDRLCAGIPPERRAVCPMSAWAQSVDDIEGGVVLHLNASAPPPAETQKRMRCHRAWMAHDPANAMPRCPLGAPGITITATAGTKGTDLTLVATQPEDVQEVRKRTHAALAK